MEQTVKKKFGIRDIMTIAAMMVITYLIAMGYRLCYATASGGVLVRFCRY